MQATGPDCVCCLLQLQDMGGNATRVEVETAMQRYGKIKFIEMIKDPVNRTLCSAIVRFDRHGQAKTAVQVRAMIQN
jgi:hypothetical protein